MFHVKHRQIGLAARGKKPYQNDGNQDSGGDPCSNSVAFAGDGVFVYLTDSISQLFFFNVREKEVNYIAKPVEAVRDDEGFIAAGYGNVLFCAHDNPVHERDLAQGYVLCAKESAYCDHFIRKTNLSDEAVDCKKIEYYKEYADGYDVRTGEAGRCYIYYNWNRKDQGNRHRYLK